MTKHLNFDMMWAQYHNIKQVHPQVVMDELGITYQHATPQSIMDGWIFWNCENIPELLPPYLSVVDCNPMKAIGYGLSKEQAEMIRGYKLNK